VTAITLRNLPQELQSAIQRKAKSEGLSLNKAVQELLAEAVGLHRGRKQVLYDDLDHLAGVWSEEEAAEFDATLREQRVIEPEMWK
jgi:plasmid stability protein